MTTLEQKPRVHRTLRADWPDSLYSRKVPCLKITGAVTKFLFKSKFPIPVSRWKLYSCFFPPHAESHFLSKVYYTHATSRYIRMTSLIFWIKLLCLASTSAAGSSSNITEEKTNSLDILLGIRRKELRISFIGLKPFITYNPIGGSDFLVLNLLAKKYGFIPKLIPEVRYDDVEVNGTILHGSIHRVSSAYFHGTHYISLQIKCL